MNILGDFITRVNNLFPNVDNEELNSLLTTIKNQEDELEIKDKEIEKLQHMMRHLETLEGEQTAKGTKKRRLSGKRKNKYVNRS